MPDCFAQEQGAGLQAEQRDGIAAVEGHGLDLRVVDSIAEGRIGRVQRLRRGRHVHSDGFRVHRQIEVNGGRLVYQKLGGLGLGTETLC